MKRLLIFFCLLVMMSPASHSKQNIKAANVSGQFYDADPQKLTAMMDRFLGEADVAPINGHPEIIIAPHAGYIYSGPVAAYAFKAASQASYSTIVIIGPTHYYNFKGISIWNQGGYQTPLGVAPVDEDFAQQLMTLNKNVYHKPNVFEREHSVEVEIPFVQHVFKDAKIVPMIMGTMTTDLIKEFVVSLRQVIGERKDVLIVISSDMSHFHEDEEARKLDDKAAEVIQTLDVDTILNAQREKLTEIDGIFPIVTAVVYANDRGIQRTEFLRYANSGDVTGDRSSVVGYLAMAFVHEEAAEKSADGLSALTKSQKKRLVDIATETIHRYVETGEIPEYKETDPRLSVEEGAFVTIHKKGALRGCIGHIIGQGPLYETVRDVAIAASSSDPRFPRVTAEELKDIDIEVSVLSKPRRIKDVDEIKMGTHGVILRQGSKSGVFLPQVATETGWGKEQFLSTLSAQKAQLKPDAWKDPKTQIEIFTADVFSEKDVK